MHGAVNLRSPIALASDGEPELQNRIAGATQLGRDHGAPISIRNLTVRFGKLLAVDNVSLEIPNGQFVSIVGPSGCGKTTVLNILTGLLPVTEGDISLRGWRPVAGNPDVAYMLARDSLLPWRTAVGNVQYGMEIRGVGGAEREVLAREQLRRVGLGKFADVYPKMLSQGMRQRCALARTFCLPSPILLMDEPFGALDAQTKMALEDLLLELWSRERRTVVFITHDLAEAVAVSDRIVVIPAANTLSARVGWTRRSSASRPALRSTSGRAWSTQGTSGSILATPSAAPSSPSQSAALRQL